MSVDALLHNATTAMGDEDLMGDTLMEPIRKCVEAYGYSISAMDGKQEGCQRVFEVFKRSAAFFVATLAVAPSIGLAGMGAASKLVDLYAKFDEKVSQSEISDYIPLILKQFSRTGDRTVTYLRARVAADEVDMPLYYKPFKGSEIFFFDQMEQNRGPKYFREVVYLNTQEQVEALKGADKTQSVLYLLPFASFYREIEKEGDACSMPKYHPDWTQHKVRLSQLLTIESEQLELPEDAYPIALHIRDGGDYDDNNTKTLHPLKLPSLNFYIGELNRVIEMKKNEGEYNFFIHIFTDAIDPESVLDQIRGQVNAEGVDLAFSFAPREEATLRFDAGNMHRFKCMIRADSNLSGPITAASETELDIFPSGFTIDEDEVVISQVYINQAGKEKVAEATGYRKPMQGWLPMWFNRFFYSYFGLRQVPLAEE
ncbi:MAG: hypothetical protein COT85_06390 [Chlamydiae bacterium CG10_big_fil_rev_8_21_14_0_10_42_34]|nr:MAG: hypothetical protein COT85_06390 [Chlamydiae bacterium CG10_big_fil_rev_8_21_14_0_10_42_34]